MGSALAWIAAFLLPAVLGWAALGAVRAFNWLAARVRPGIPSVEPIELLGANLCRLHAALEAAENDTEATPYKATRLRALRGAYVDVLSEACRRLDVAPPGANRPGQVPLTEIYRAEAALRERGLDVRQPAQRR